MKGDIDIHEFSVRMEKMRVLVVAGGVSAKSQCKKRISCRNSDLILEYDKVRSLEGVKLPTRTADMFRLLVVARLLGNDFDKASKEEIKDMICRVDSKFGLWTRAKHRMTFKRFYKWMRYGDDYQSSDEYPEEVRWIRRGLKKRDLPRIQRGDCWTEEEMKKLIGAATHPRDRALVAVLTETGARVGEIGGLRIGDVYQDEFSYLLHLKGKTGEREDAVLYSGPYLAEWLNIHPDRNNPNAPLFTKLHRRDHLNYRGICTILKRLAKKAGLQHKKCNPHIFRHSRATLLAEQGWPEPIIKAYLGWQKDSDMMSTYSHLTSRQANRYMLKVHGLVKADAIKPKLKAQLCVTCHAQNGPEAKFCTRCGRPLTHEAILKYGQAMRQGSGVLDELTGDKELSIEFLALIKRLLEKRKASVQPEMPEHAQKRVTPTENHPPV